MQSSSVGRRFFGVVLRGQTYLNALYLWLSFPLGLAYFVFLVLGFALGIPLMFVGVGLVILFAVFWGWVTAVAWERKLAVCLLRVDVPLPKYPSTPTDGALLRLKRTLIHPATWKGLLYLIAKFPLGMISFVVGTSLMALSLVLITAPLYYQYASQLMAATGHLWTLHTLPQALACTVAGAGIGLLSLHVFNGLAWFNAQFARVMLDGTTPLNMTE